MVTVKALHSMTARQSGVDLAGVRRLLADGRTATTASHAQTFGPFW